MSRRAWVVAVVVGLAAVATVLLVTPAGEVVRRSLLGSREKRPAQSAASPAIPMPAGQVSDSPVRGEVSLDARRQQLIGVRTAPVVRGSLASEIRVVGTVRFDERRQAEVNTRVDGWIRELFADYTGKPVRQGDPLFTLYSPELVTTQNEYLLARRGHTHTTAAEVSQVRDFADRLVQAARERLLRFDMSEEDLRALEQRGTASDTITIRAPMAGVVVDKPAIRGMRVMAGQTVLRIADVSRVWVEANVHEQDIASIRIGQAATMTLDAYPGDSFTGRATYIHTALDEATRTLRVRFEFANSRGQLRPGMFATLAIRGAGVSGLTVPPDAILDSGTQSIVFVAQGDGYFVPRPVKVGRRTGDAVEIVEGLKEGEQVASGATFFLDSESQLRSGLQNYQPSAPGVTGAPAAGAALDITFRALPDPPKTGENQFEVMVKQTGGQAVTDAEVTVQLFMPAMPTMNMPEMRNEASVPHVGGGTYRGMGQVIMAGRWDVTVTVVRNGQQLGRRQFAVVAR
jgi:RND family efflux transporter MFP subunit